MERKSLSISVQKFYTDVDGNILDKNTLPSDLKITLPVWLMGRFDYSGHYSLSRRLTPFLNDSWKFFNMYVSTSYDFLIFSGANQIRSRIRPGDLIFVYSDDVINPNFYSFIIISGEINPYSSIINDLDGSINCLMFKYDSIQNTLNYQEEIEYITFDKIGNTKRQSIQPDTFLPPSNKNTDVIDIEISILFTKYFSLNTYLLFNTDKISFTFLLASARFNENNKKDFILNEAKFI